MHDLVIRGGTIVDGNGGAPYRGDVAIDGDRITALGEAPGKGRQEIDADGLAVAPGFIDIHTHYDAQYTWDPYATSSIWHGITTTVIGNCGFAIAPCKPEHRKRVMATLVQVEGMSLKAMEEGIEWGFETFPQYLDFLQSTRPALNIGAFVPHSTVRYWVMGPAAQEREATTEEVAQMAGLVREAMSAGAIGFASSTLEAHNGEDGVPVPSRFANFEELKALTKAVGEGGKGIFEITVGMDTGLDKLKTLHEVSSRPVCWAALLHRDDIPEMTTQRLEATTEFLAAGVEVRPQVLCRPLTMDFSIGNPYCFGGLKVWNALFKKPASEWPAAYADPAFRRGFREELKGQHPAAFRGRWDLVRVLKTAKAENRHLEGKAVTELPRGDGGDDVDAILDLALADGLGTKYLGGLMNTDDEWVGKMITHPGTLIALSDAGAHNHLLCDAGYTGTLLSKWVRDRQTFTLEAAVKRLTADNADYYRIPQRGRLRPGNFADLAIFDPATVAALPNQWVMDLPGGEGRFVCRSEGVRWSIVNGVPVMKDGEVIERPPAERSGQVLRQYLS